MRQFLLLFVLLVWLPVAGGAQAISRDNIAPHEVLLKLQPGTSLSADAQAHGTQSTSLNTALRTIKARAALSLGAQSNTYRIRLDQGMLPEQAASQLAAIPGVTFATPNAMRQSLLIPNDPIFKQQWALRNIHAPEAWDITTGAAIPIAILDTGVNASHEDLKGQILPGYDFYNNDDDPSDDEGHGTYTAGVAVAIGNNGKGIAGVCWQCRVMPIKVLGDDGSGSDAMIAAGIYWAVDHGARIISMSLGGDEDTPVLRDAVSYARDHNVLLIAASGNGKADGNAPNYPAAYDDVLAVAATDGSDVVTGFSTTGSFVDVTAPGVGVWSTSIDGHYEAQNGTSAACPHVAGVAGLVLSLRPTLSAVQLGDLLRATADDQGTPGKDDINGYGRINALRAVQMAADPSIDPSQAIPASAPSPFSAVSDPQDGTRFFSETGHTLRGAFLSFWERNGGLPIFGYPLSEEFTEQGDNGQSYTVQYFERHRLEYHPENSAPYDVLLGRMGVDQLAYRGVDWQQFPSEAARSGCRFFAETGQNICGEILTAWRANGLEIDGQGGISEAESLALFGMPISPIVIEAGADGINYQVQWFERARFELHPENQPPYTVLLGLLGADSVRQRGAR